MVDFYVWELVDGPTMTVTIPPDFDDGPTWTDLEIFPDSAKEALYRKIGRFRIEELDD